MTKSVASLLVSAALLAVSLLPAQAQKPEARILVPVDNSARATLTGSRPAMLRNATDAGRMSGMTPIQSATFAFSRSAAQEAALETLIAAQQNPASPQYQQWLSPDQFAAQFGAADADIQKVEAWLQQQGFTIDEVGRNKSLIRFSGNVAQIEAAFGVEMHNYTVGTEKHFGPASDLTVPAAFSGAALTVANLSDFRPKSHLRVPTARFTSAQSGSHFVTPKDVATIYDINAAYAAGWTGSGQTIAVIGQSGVVAGDISNFQTAAGVPVRAPNMTVIAGTGASTVISGDETESDLDLEYTSAIARGATIDFVYTGNSPNYGAFDALSYAIVNKTALIISMSYGTCEPRLSASGTPSGTLFPTTASTYYTYYNAFTQQAAAQGQTIIAAAGDAGSTDCYGETPGGTYTTAQEAGLAADWPASSQYVTGLGGTEYVTADVATANSTYFLATTGSDAIGSAVSYIPEQAWNDDNIVANGAGGLSSGGGGISILTPAPTWQTGVPGISSITSGGFRLVPDVSLASSPNNAGYLYCSSDSSTGITGSCSYGFRDQTDSNLTIIGGTSVAAPIFAGMMAIIAQSKGNTTGMGLVNPTLYTLASNSSTYASAFHDITSGNNACTVGTTYADGVSTTTGATLYGPACASGGSYSATTGYDLATGLGSVDLNNLLTAWPGTTATAPAKFTLSVASTTISAGSTGTASITITPTGGYTGTVNLTFTSNPLIAYACFAPASGTVTGTTAATATATIYTTTLSTSSSACPTTGVQALSQGGGKVAAAKAPAQPGRHVPGELPAGIGAAGLLAIGFMGRRSRRLRGVIAVAALALVAGFGLAGCGGGGTATGVVGGGGGTTTTTGGTAAKGTYTVTVSGEDSVTGLQESTTFSLTLQ